MKPNESYTFVTFYYSNVVSFCDFYHVCANVNKNICKIIVSFHFYKEKNTDLIDWQPQSHLDNRRRIGYFQIKFAGYSFFFIDRNGGCYKNFIIVHWYLATIRHHLDHSGQASLSQPNGKCVSQASLNQMVNVSPRVFDP